MQGTFPSRAAGTIARSGSVEVGQNETKMSKLLAVDIAAQFRRVHSDTREQSRVVEGPEEGPDHAWPEHDRRDRSGAIEGLEEPEQTMIIH